MAPYLENPLARFKFSVLVRNPVPTVRDSIITVAADDVFYQREDRLCTGLREGKVVDFRGSNDDGRFKQALSALIREFEDSPFSF